MEPIFTTVRDAMGRLVVITHRCEKFTNVEIRKYDAIRECKQKYDIQEVLLDGSVR